MLPNLKLITNNIDIGYETKKVIRNLSLSINPGEFIGVVGPNGSGKSTLVKTLSRVLPPSSGVVLLSDQDLYRSISARTSAQSIATVPQSTTISFDFTVREIVEMGRTPYRPLSPFSSMSNHDTQIVSESMRHAGVEHLANRSAVGLSGGEQQRVIIARALAQEPKILLLDEPTAHLDLHHQAHILRLVRDLTRTRNIAALAVLHDLNLAADYCDRIILIGQGRLIADGTPADVLTEANIRSVYGASVWVRYHPVTGRPYILSLPELPAADVNTEQSPHIHIICGAGTGVRLMLLLRQLGYNITIGAVNTGDTDQEAALMMGIPCAAESPFTALSEKVLDTAWNYINDASVIIVTDVPFGNANAANLRLALKHLKNNGQVIALSPPEFPSSNTSNIEDCADNTSREMFKFSARDFTNGVAADIWSQLLNNGMQIATDIDIIIDTLSR